MDDATDRPHGRQGDGDPALRALAAELARDDPALAALLGGPAPAPRRGVVRTVLVLLVVAPLVVLALVRAPTVTTGVLGFLLVLAAPLGVCWLCADDADDAGSPGPT
ncbi:DUF3040 domain-containing protein [Blastococcus tunisiensis]|uniref:DUF3040 domain-containing protein n=1 Tax=Blastococcus tunisiensis TaxID=1798228 RepID=A0A1I2H8D3_9ACTN|nr:DUF3040 domain-containing protein [Blastococcus sp. DSM 46838]SFF25848.1 Protein of unknown function [Blastococcus sp. DSM 46838]